MLNYKEVDESYFVHKTTQPILYLTPTHTHTHTNPHTNTHTPTHTHTPTPTQTHTHPHTHTNTHTPTRGEYIFGGQYQVREKNK